MDLDSNLNKFCLISSLLSIIYFSGQSGFNTGLIAMIDEGDPKTYIVLCAWLCLEGPIMCMSSALMGYGLYSGKKQHILKWCIVASVCLLVYTILSLIELIGVQAKIDLFPQFGVAYYFRRFDLIGLVWRLFLVISIIVNGLVYKSMKQN